jgi:phosphatidylglycerophosphatase A
VVADEVVGQWITLIGAPANWAFALIGLILFRLFDITKPTPVREIERLPGGWGIMLDDVGAGIYALVVVQIVSHFVR